jgi:hypothetical protein
MPLIHLHSLTVGAKGVRLVNPFTSFYVQKGNKKRKEEREKKKKKEETGKFLCFEEKKKKNRLTLIHILLLQKIFVSRD